MTIRAAHTVRRRALRTAARPSRRPRAIALLTTAAAIAATAAPAHAATPPAQGNTGVLDTTGVLKLNPPLSSAPTVSPFTADQSLVDQLVVHVCKFDSAGGCAEVASLSQASGGLQQLRRVGPLYLSTWSASGAKAGDMFKLTFRVARLNIGSTTMRAVGPLELLGIPRAGTFVAGLPVPIAFSVDNNPVVRARSEHDRGLGGVDSAIPLQREFHLDDTDAFRVLYHDVRNEDILFVANPTLSKAAAAKAAPVAKAGTAKVAAAAASSVNPTAFHLSDVFDGVGSPATYGDKGARAAQLARDLTPSSDQTIVNGLATSGVLHGSLTPSGLLGVIRDTLGVADKLTGLRLLASASNDTCDPNSGPCAPAYDATTVLQAISQIDGLTSILQALGELADAGYPVRDSAQAVLAVKIPGTLADGTTADPNKLKAAILKLAEAMVQIPAFGDADIKDALDKLYSSPTARGDGGGTQAPGAFPDALGGPGQAANEASKGLVAKACALYDGLPAPGSIPELLAPRKDDILPVKDVITALMGCNGGDLTKAAKGLHNAYFAGVADKAVEAIDIGEGLVGALPKTPASDMLLALGNTLKGVVSGDKLSCLSVLGVVKGAQGAKLPGAAALPGGVPEGFDLFHAAGGLDQTPDLQKLFPNPYDKGNGASLQQLGECLGVNGLFPEIPLRKITVRFESGVFVRVASVTPDPMWTARVGWAPEIPDELAPITGLPGLNQLKLTQVPNVDLLGGKLSSLTTLPAFAAGPGIDGTGASRKVTFPDNGRGCLVAFPGPCADPNLPSLVDTSGSDKVFKIAGLPVLSLAGVGSRNGVFQMIVPALKGHLNIESAQYVSPHLSCFPGGGQPVSEAAAIALPWFGGYDQLPGGDADILAAKQQEEPLLDKPNSPDGKTVTQSFELELTSYQNCGRSVGNDFLDSGKGRIRGTITVERFGDIVPTDLLSKVLDNPAASPATVATVAGAKGPDGKTVGPTGPVGAISSLNPESAAGNFFSLLALSGGAPVTGKSLQGLGTTGFLP